FLVGVSVLSRKRESKRRVPVHFRFCWAKIKKRSCRSINFGESLPTRKTRVGFSEWSRLRRRPCQKKGEIVTPPQGPRLRGPHGLHGFFRRRSCDADCSSAISRR